jgi:hypothetical protein
MAMSRVLAVGACGVLSVGLLLPIVPSPALTPAHTSDVQVWSSTDLWLVPASLPATPSPLARAIRTLTEGDAPGAIPALRQAVDDDPLLGPYALLYLGRAELALERPAAAAAEARRILEAAPGGYVGEAALWLLADA